MKAVIYTKYGPPEVLQLKEVEKPVPKDNEVLIKVHATTVTSGDARMRGFRVPPLPWLPMRLYLGLFRPRRPVLGSEFAGVIEAAGRDVKKFKAGDQVFGTTASGFGACAEYICQPEDGIIALKPSNLSFEEAVPVFFGGHTALHFLRKGNIQRGQKVLIYGASGCIGTFAVQLARHFGAQVTGVCSSANLELVKSLGADKVIDYTKEDFSISGETYDVIFDTVGKSPFSGSLKSLKGNGKFIRAVHMTLLPLLRGLWANLTSGRKVIGGVAGEKLEDFIFLKGLIEAGELKPVIDRTYPFEQIAEAHRHVDEGHKKGSIVITLAHNNKI